MHSFVKILTSGKPVAVAILHGSEDFLKLRGIVSFYPVDGGSLVTVEATGLPRETPFAAVHIHAGSSCSGDSSDPFKDTGSHLNFRLLDHPLHTGDFPALLNAEGYGWGAFFTDRFTPCNVKGYTVVIHLHPDDYHTQPSGGAGEKIACGVIMPVKRQ